MAKNIEAQGIRIGYIIGGILAVLLSALLIVLYLPDFLTTTFGIQQIWDLRTPITELVGSNAMEYFETWGPAGIMVLFFLIYFVCMSARQSASATMFRLTGMFGALGCSLPFVAGTLDTMNLVDLTNYVGYAMLGTFVLSFVFYIIGIIVRCKQKFHKNKASTTLAFCATFWLLFLTLQTLYYVGVVFNVEALTTTFLDIITFVNANVFTILAIFLLISAIWMFLTVPHHVRVQYNADTPNMSRPVISPEEQAKNVKLSPEEEATAKQRSNEDIKESGAPVTQPANVYPHKQLNNTPNPYRRKPLQPIPASPQMQQPRISNPQAFNQNFGTVRQVNPQSGIQQNFYNTQNNQNITPNNPYNPTMPNAMPRPVVQQSQQNMYNQPRPVVQPMPQQPRPVVQPQFQPRPIVQPNPFVPQPTQQVSPQPRSFAQPIRPTGQIYPNQQQTIRPAMPNTPNMASNLFNQNGTNTQTRPFNQPQAFQPRPTVQPMPQQTRPTVQPQPRPFVQPYTPTGQGQQPNVANNPNNYIPNNIRPINPNTPNGSNNNTNNGSNGNNGW